MPAPVAATAIALAVAAGMVAACGGGDDSFSLHLSWRTTGSMPCPASSCASMELLCDAMVAVRIVDARDPSRVYVDRCVALDAAPDLCGLADLPIAGDELLPTTAVRVQVAIWPRDAVGAVCPTGVLYDLQGLPQLLGNHPAIGGEQLTQLGGRVVDVALACPNIDALASEVCLAGRPIRVDATVDDFAKGRSVEPSTADYLILSAGEPALRPVEGGSQWELVPTDLSQLVPDSSGRGDPAWTGVLPAEAEDIVCLEVLHRTEGGPTATCRTLPPAARSLDLRGSHVGPELRQKLFGALGIDSLPADGLVVGRVVDRNGAPVPGVSVSAAPAASVVYVATDGARIDLGIAQTSASGMFVSIDAAPRTTWSVTDSSPTPVPATPSAIGGRINGHLTVVELVLGEPASQE